MCGKFTAMASWAEVVAFSQPLTADRDYGRNDEPVTLKVMGAINVIVWDEAEQRRKVVPMRWGFPHPKNWRIPQPIHARSETIDELKTFKPPFLAGKRGIVLMRTFNEAPDVEGPTVQHVITPGDGGMLAAAFLWRRFEIPGQPQPMFACVMVTVSANTLLSGLPTDRMPAFLAPEDWAVWLGEEPASLAEVKACLKTVNDVRWTMTPEERAKSTKRGKPTVSDPAGLF